MTLTNQICHLTTYVNSNDNAPIKKQVLFLLYAGKKDFKLIRSLRKNLQQTLTSNIKTSAIYTTLEESLSSVIFEELLNVVHYWSISNN